MIIPISSVTNLISLGVIAAQISVAALFLAALLPKTARQIRTFFSKYILEILFVIALGATLGSLFYSSIAGLVPCKLCWYQRILLFPQVIVLAIALWKKDRNAADYALGLSIIGIIIAIYHYYIQFGGVELVTPCTLNSLGASCADKPFVTYGYITIPMMSLTTFLMLIATSAVSKLKK